MKKTIYRLFIELTNGKWSSRMLQKFSKSTRSKFVISSYAKVFQINQQEMQQSLKNYQSLHELFIRQLREGARVIDEEQSSVISPVDAVIEEIGQVEKSKQITVKGKVYSIAEMLGGDQQVNKYVQGTYMIFYLSPSDYHRIHSPVSGKVMQEWELGTKSYPVNKLGLKYGRSPLSKNYRMITEVKHEAGRLAIVKVGAMFVNSIEKIYEGDMLTKGMEIAYFTFGSTVILLFEQDTFIPLPDIKAGMKIKVGERVGILTQKGE